MILHYKFDSKLDLGFHREREREGNGSIIERELVLSLALMVVINNVGVKICYEKNRERVFHACVLREILFKKILNNLVYSPN